MVFIFVITIEELDCCSGLWI